MTHATVYGDFLEEFLEDFYVKVDTDPEVDSPVALGKLELFLRALCLLLRMRQMEAFGRISRSFSVTANSIPEVDSPMEPHGSVRDKVFIYGGGGRRVFSRESSKHR